MQITNRRVLITGASSGLGEALARLMAAQGAELILLARNIKKLKELKAEFAKNNIMAHVYQVDLLKRAQVEQAAKQIKKAGLIPDVIVNNAGAGRWLALEETPGDEAEEMMAVPYFAAFHLTKAFLPEFLARDSGQIICVTSPAGEIGIPGAVAYSVARFAMRGFYVALKADLAKTKIKVSLFSAGKISSSYFDNNPGSEEKIPGVAATVPTLTPDAAAKALLHCIEKEKGYYVVPWLMNMYILTNRVWPGFVAWLVNLTSKHRSKRQSKRDSKA